MSWGRCFSWLEGEGGEGLYRIRGREGTRSGKGMMGGGWGERKVSLPAAAQAVEAQT